jgi:hypothetical protein
MPASRVVVNTPTTHGAIGFSTALPPSMTLGCGSWGGNVTRTTSRRFISWTSSASRLKPIPFEAADHAPQLRQRISPRHFPPGRRTGDFS